MNIAAPAPLSAGRLDPANGRPSSPSSNGRWTAARSGEFDAMVTGPVHKGIINDAGIAFTGHTELLAAQSGAARR